MSKWEGRPVRGQLTREELEAISAANAVRAREVGYDHVEVDLDRQVLMWVSKDGGVRAHPISSGTNTPFIDEGQNSIAYTPRGRFLVYDKEVGWGNGPLGSVYYANFISGGVAIHGSRSVPSSTSESRLYSHTHVRRP